MLLGTKFLVVLFLDTTLDSVLWLLQGSCFHLKRSRNDRILTREFDIIIQGGRVEKTNPRSKDYPTDYSTDFPKDYPYRQHLIINQIPFTG